MRIEWRRALNFLLSFPLSHNYIYVPFVGALRSSDHGRIIPKGWECVIDIELGISTVISNSMYLARG